MTMLETKGLGISFGGIKAVQGLDLSVGAREIAGLIGPNGAGKTTAFNLITGIYQPTTGSVSLDGKSITGLRAHEVTRRGAARTFQNIRLFKTLPVVQNVLVGFHVNAGYGLPTSAARGRRFEREEARLLKEAHELLDLLGRASRAHDLAGNLSYGDQRRLVIARALGTRP